MCGCLPFSGSVLRCPRYPALIIPWRRSWIGDRHRHGFHRHLGFMLRLIGGDSTQCRSISSRLNGSNGCGKVSIESAHDPSRSDICIRSYESVLTARHIGRIIHTSAVQRLPPDPGKTAGQLKVLGPARVLRHSLDNLELRSNGQ